MSTPRIGVVGVCAAGKSTLSSALRQMGYDARQISQEHSYVPDLWQRFSRADVLIYLDCGLETIRRRRDDPTWPGDILDRERDRLRHARDHCHLYLPTDDLAPPDVLARVLALLSDLGVDPGPAPFELPHWP